MEAVTDKDIFNEIISRFTEPAKYKIKFYQIAVLMYIDQILTLLINKYMFFRVKIEEQKTNLKIIQFQHAQELLKAENLKKSLILVEKLNDTAKNSFGEFFIHLYLN